MNCLILFIIKKNINYALEVDHVAKKYYKLYDSDV